MNEFSWDPWRINLRPPVCTLESLKFPSGFVWKRGIFWSFFRKKGNQYFNNSDHDIFKSLEWGCPGALYLDDPEIYIMFQCEHCIEDPLVEGVRHFCSSGSRSRFEECFKGFLLKMNYFSDRRVHGWHPWAKCKVHSAGGIQLCSCDCSKSLPFLLSESCMFRTQLNLDSCEKGRIMFEFVGVARENTNDVSSEEQPT